MPQHTMGELNTAADQPNAEWGSQTLRQACYRVKPESAMCVQNFHDSRGLAIRITYRISLRSSSLWEPRHPPLKVVLDCFTSVSSTLTGSETLFTLVLNFKCWFVVKVLVEHHSLQYVVQHIDEIPGGAQTVF